MSDLLYFAGGEHSPEEYCELEVWVVTQTAHSFGSVLHPSEICTYVLLSLGISQRDEKMLQFMNNLCLHERWKNGSELSAFALGFSAVLVYFEQLNHVEVVSKMISLIFVQWEEGFRHVYPEVSVARSRLVDSARCLTNDQQCIERFNFMVTYSFEELVSYIAENSVEIDSKNSENSFILEKECEKI